MILKNFSIFITAAMILSFAASTSIKATTNVFGQEDMQMDKKKNYIVSDEVTIPLQGLIISGGSHLHLYDTGHYHIMDGHVSVKVPCNDNGEPLLQVMGGIADDVYKMRPIELHPTANMSMGGTCMYHADIASDMGPQGWIYTDISLRNPSQNDITFPANSVAIVGVNEIMMDPTRALATQGDAPLPTGIDSDVAMTGTTASNETDVSSMNMNMSMNTSMENLTE